MKTDTEKIYELLCAYNIKTVSDAFNLRCKTEDERVSEAKDWLLGNGYEIVSVHDGRRMTQDGREILHAHGEKWALTMEAWEKRKDDAIGKEVARIKMTETKSVAGTEELSGIVCPKCKDSLQYSRICPNCAAGKAGFRHMYSCVCGVEIVSKEVL